MRLHKIIFADPDETENYIQRIHEAQVRLDIFPRIGKLTAPRHVVRREAPKQALLQRDLVEG